MHICNTLAGVVRQHITFDPTNAQHLEAFRTLVIGEAGPQSSLRQHPTLRFNLEHPFDNVRSLMVHKVAEHHLKTHGIVA
jgi:hypothetical protein